MKSICKVIVIASMAFVTQKNNSAGLKLPRLSHTAICVFSPELSLREQMFPLSESEQFYKSDSSYLFFFLIFIASVLSVDRKSERDRERNSAIQMT